MILVALFLKCDLRRRILENKIPVYQGVEKNEKSEFAELKNSVEGEKYNENRNG